MRLRHPATIMDNVKSTIREVIRLLTFLVDDNALTYGEWLREWFDLYKRGKLKDRTVYTLERYIRDRIIPCLGGYRLCDLSGAEIQSFINSIERGNTRKKIAFVLNASLRKAVALRKILFNPFDAVEVPGYRKGHYRALEFDEQNMIWNYYLNPVAYYNYLDVRHMQAVFFFMCCTGLRIGEFLALDWKKDVDRRKRTIVINKSMDKESGKISSTKTEHSDRMIAYLPELQPYIDVIAANEYTYLSVSEHFRKLYRRLEIVGANVHSFRHTFISMCYAAGMRDKYIQLYVGHADITTMLNIYTHGLDRGTSPLYEYIQDLAEYLQRR